MTHHQLLQCSKNYLNFSCLPVVGIVVGASVVYSEMNCNEVLSLQ